jgi:hypothetical protein
VWTLINRKVFQRGTKPITVVHVRSMDLPNIVNTLVTMSLYFIDGHCKSESHRKLQPFELERHICRNHWNAWQQYIFPLNFPFNIVASMLLFIIFFTGLLVTGLLVTGHFGRAHYNYAKFLYNHLRVQLITYSLVTWSPGHLVTWSLGHLVTNSLREFYI